MFHIHPHYSTKQCYCNNLLYAAQGAHTLDILPSIHQLTGIWGVFGSITVQLRTPVSWVYTSEWNGWVTGSSGFNCLNIIVVFSEDDALEQRCP